MPFEIIVLTPHQSRTSEHKLEHVTKDFIMNALAEQVRRFDKGGDN